MDHDLLIIRELEALSVAYPMCSWLMSCLTHRKQYIIDVYINLHDLVDLVSTMINISFSIPQGDHLRILLLILFVDSIKKKNGKMIIYELQYDSVHLLLYYFVNNICYVIY